MDTHSKVILTSNFNDFSLGDFTNLVFHNSISDIEIEKAPSFKEYQTLKISHTGNHSDKLYFDIFDTIDSENLKDDERNFKYLNNNEVLIIDYNQNKIINTLVPGYYLLKLITDKTLYSLIEIVPKDLKKQEWSILYNDVNDFVNGLANSYINKTNSKITLERKKSNVNEQISYILQNRVNILKSLRSLNQNPRFVMRKEYSWSYIGNQQLFDTKSIKMQLQNQSQKNSVYSYRKKLEFNNLDNRWLKRTLRRLRTSLKLILDHLRYSIEQYNNLSTSKFSSDQLESRYTLVELNNIYKKINNIFYLINTLLEAEWIQEIDSFVQSQPTYSALMDPNYNTIYKWQKELNKRTLSMQLSKTIINSWKRTDELYEIWCYIQVIKILEMMNFKPISGWLFDEIFNDDLIDGTYITFERDNISINVHYNSTIKGGSKETNTIHPLYTLNTKNKPDIRIDIFVNKVYINSIILDSKYRKLKNIISRTNHSLEQLNSYASSLSSLLYESYNDSAKIRRRWKRHTFVSKVIVLFPVDKSEDKPESRAMTLMKDHALEFIEFDPGSGRDNLQKVIEKEIGEVLLVYEDIYE